jgi:Secretion system C-terminal sorting domain
MSSVGWSQTAVERFLYPVGTVLDTLNPLGTAANGFSAGWTWNRVQAPVALGAGTYTRIIADSGIEFGNLNFTVPHDSRCFVSVSKNTSTYYRFGRYLSQNWDTTNGKVYWLSMFYEIKNLGHGSTGGANTSCWAGLKLYDSLGDVALLGKGWGQNYFSFGSGAPATVEQSSSSWNVGPVWLVVRMNMNPRDTAGGGAHMMCYMWVTPDPSVQPDTGAADVKTREYVHRGINSLGLEYGSYGGDSLVQMAVADIRMGTKWSDVSSALTGVISRGGTSPSQYALSQNYPNPFNPSTKIDYSVPKNSFVTLKVYNVLGQEVATLFSGTQEAGNYASTFDASKFTSGLYFYRLEADGVSITKKMLLMK